jgi:hypothetical protein
MISGTMISGNSDGIMELPVFHVYASDSESIESNAPMVNTNWKFKKSLDVQSESYVVQVLGPEDTSHMITTPGIKVDLVNVEIDNL